MAFYIKGALNSVLYAGPVGEKEKGGGREGGWDVEVGRERGGLKGVDMQCHCLNDWFPTSNLFDRPPGLQWDPETLLLSHFLFCSLLPVFLSFILWVCLWQRRPLPPFMLCLLCNSPFFLFLSPLYAHSLPTSFSTCTNTSLLQWRDFFKRPYCVPVWKLSSFERDSTFYYGCGFRKLDVPIENRVFIFPCLKWWNVRHCHCEREAGNWSRWPDGHDLKGTVNSSVFFLSPLSCLRKKLSFPLEDDVFQQVRWLFTLSWFAFESLLQSSQIQSDRRWKQTGDLVLYPFVPSFFYDPRACFLHILFRDCILHVSRFHPLVLFLKKFISIFFIILSLHHSLPLARTRFSSVPWKVWRNKDSLFSC